MRRVNGRFAILILIVLSGCSDPQPDLAELQTACAAGQAGACQAHQDMLNRIQRTQSGQYTEQAVQAAGQTVRVNGAQPGLTCQQGFESELECTRY